MTLIVIEKIVIIIIVLVRKMAVIVLSTKQLKVVGRHLES